MTPSVLMIGHSTHSWRRFVQLLHDSKVSTLIDVRTYPRSYHPHFNEAEMAVALPGQGIAYRHLRELGGKNPRPLAEIRAQVSQLLPLPPGVCLMCSEGNHTECHRHYLLTPLFLELGISVLQINRDGTLTSDSGPTPATLAKTRAFRPPKELQMRLFPE